MDNVNLFKISKIASSSNCLISTIDEITALIRPNFIIDNIVIYKINRDCNDLEAIYARSLGRGKNAEADVSWGEIIASKIIEQKKVIVDIPTDIKENNRLKNTFLLGIPINIMGSIEGSIIFIRFGGPEFSIDEIGFGEFIAEQVSVLLGRIKIEDEYNELQSCHKQIQLQEDFISTVSHELRSPLGFIKGYATTLLRTDISWDKNSENKFLKIIDQEADHLLELINNLLDSSRLQSGQMQMVYQPVQIDSTIKDVITRSQMRCPECLINLTIGDSLQPIIGDPSRLAQVFENLINNATKYAPKSNIDISIEQTPDQTFLYFKDYGPGIAEEHQPFIFDRFYRVRDNSHTAHGSGLGLYICREIIIAHNGTINVISEENKGTTFEIILPNTRSSF